MTRPNAPSSPAGSGSTLTSLVASQPQTGGTAPPVESTEDHAANIRDKALPVPRILQAGLGNRPYNVIFLLNADPDRAELKIEGDVIHDLEIGRTEDGRRHIKLTIQEGTKA